MYSEGASIIKLMMALNTPMVMKTPLKVSSIFSISFLTGATDDILTDSSFCFFRRYGYSGENTITRCSANHCSG
jgi:hypothetical protein